MNTKEIAQLLKRIPGIRNTGVYASDCLPLHISPSTAIVVNTDPHTRSGTHWVVFYLDEDGNRIEYFDSFGLPPHLPYYQQFLKRNARRYVYNEHRLQGYNSFVCAHYCLTFLYSRANGLTMNEFVNAFSFKNTTLNDGFIYSLYKSIF